MEKFKKAFKNSLLYLAYLAFLAWIYVGLHEFGIFFSTLGSLYNLGLSIFSFTIGIFGIVDVIKNSKEI